MATPLSIRFDSRLLDRLRRTAGVAATTPSGLAQRLVDEGLRSAEHPGVMFRDGPTGRRAALAAGPDVWEVIAVLKGSEARGEAAVTVVADEMSLTDGQVRLALAYYGDWPDEIDSQVMANEEATERAYAAWQARQRLLA